MAFDHLQIAPFVDGQRRRRLLNEAEHATAPLCEMLGMAEVKATIEEMILSSMALHNETLRAADAHRSERRCTGRHMKKCATCLALRFPAGSNCAPGATHFGRILTPIFLKKPIPKHSKA